MGITIMTYFLQSFETDTNRDGKLDKLDFELTMPLTQDENVYGIKLFILFDVKLHVSYFMGLVMNYATYFKDILYAKKLLLFL